MLIQETHMVYNFITLKLPEINATYQKKKNVGMITSIDFHRNFEPYIKNYLLCCIVAQKKSS